MSIFDHTADRLARSRLATSEMGAALWVVLPQTKSGSVVVRGADGELTVRCQEGETEQELRARAWRLCAVLNRLTR